MNVFQPPSLLFTLFSCSIYRPFKPFSFQTKYSQYFTNTTNLLPSSTPYSNMTSSSTTIFSKCTIYPFQKSTFHTLKLSVSDLSLLSAHYIQVGVLLPPPPYSFDDLIIFLKHSLSVALTHFPPLAGRLITDHNGYVHILCNDAGVDFIHAEAKHLLIDTIYSASTIVDVPNCFKEFFAYNDTVCYSGHYNPLVAVQVTELADGVFIGIATNHAVVDGTSFFHFFNTFADICKGAKRISKSPDFTRDTVLNSAAVLRIPADGPKITFDAEAPRRERVFHFSREAIQKLKLRANGRNVLADSLDVKGMQHVPARIEEISSLQSLCALLWRSVTRARRLDPSKTSTCVIVVNCRHRVEPKMDPCYFGAAIQSIPTVAQVGEILSRDLRWCATLLHKNVVAHDDAMVRRRVEDWEKAPSFFPLGNFDGATIEIGGSPRFPVYDNDFGWGRPLAVRSGKNNKFDGMMLAYPGREGNESVDLEVVLAPETMAGLEDDMEFMQFVSPIGFRKISAHL